MSAAIPPQSDKPESEGASAVEPPRRRVFAKQVPAEGEGGVFSQTWFPICLSQDLPVGTVRGVDLLDGRVVAFRGADGAAQVMSAYCPHLGADLSAGVVVENTVRCGFHHWRFDASGVCVKTGTGDPPPRSACLFRFPTHERYGLIWAYNGHTPHFMPPAMPVPDDELIWSSHEYPGRIPVDPWVICCNTPDLQHLESVHKVVFTRKPTFEAAEWTESSMYYELDGVDGTGFRFNGRSGICGTSIFCQSGDLGGRWYSFIIGMALERPGVTRLFRTVALRRDQSSGEEGDRQLIAMLVAAADSVINDDLPILRGVHFRPGNLTQSDRLLVAFLDYLRAFPRAHPSAEFIR